jgi:hypothetical protein
MPLTNPSAVAKFEREKAQARELRRQALEMRKSGKTFREIADVQNCAIRTAMTRYNKAMKEYVPQELVESVRGTELDRFDALTQINISLLAKAYEAGDIDAVCKLQDKILAVHDRRAKLVPIQVPTRVVLDATVEHTTEQDRELRDLLSGMSKDVEDKINSLREHAAP